MKSRNITALIVDDEFHAVGNLTALIERYCNSIHLKGTASNVMDAALLCEQLQPDVIFLDINMPNKNGFELINLLKQLPFIVFVTAHDEYALKALKICALDYLLKPIDINELIQVETRMKELIQIRDIHKQNYPLIIRNFNAMRSKQNEGQRITLPVSNGYEILNPEEIIFVRGEDNYSNFVLENGKTHLVARTLKDYEYILVPFGFMRIHKSTIANLHHAKSITRDEQCQLIMTGNVALSVSRRKQAELMALLKQKNDATT